MFKRVPGTKDILPDEISRWQALEASARDAFALYNYKELRPPLIEEASLFDRSLGASTEIVQKQMFLIHNKDDLYALRPEGTASIVRSYIENNLDKSGKISKLFYLGPMFRLERPQKGRLRQFHHIGCEVIGSSSPGVDIEVISLAESILKAGGIKGYTLKINSLGCPQDKKKLMALLRDALAGKKDSLCEDCRIRYGQNVLRILDCKQEGCRTIVGELGTGAVLCGECAEHFTRVKAGLEALNIPYTYTPVLVRGLDYYTRTVFEFCHGALGAQDAIGAGGRYDNLVAELGGPAAGAAGFAFGVERLLIAAPPEASNSGNKLVFVISLGERAKEEGYNLLAQLRKAGIAADTDYEDKSLKGAM
ncbi:MAG: histidine--tRNA ligase, partial [Candidatus Omnitrophica bacterium]|nr:histidine--tRNA ligase [Candidatus Omnitrophota bacterium]